jgi:hypothetical protein
VLVWWLTNKEGICSRQGKSKYEIVIKGDYSALKRCRTRTGKVINLKITYVNPTIILKVFIKEMKGHSILVQYHD